MVFHDGQMHSITRRHLSMSHDNFLCALYCGQINGQHLVGNTEQSVERRLDGVPTIDSDVAVQYLLQDPRIRNQALSIANQLPLILVHSFLFILGPFVPAARHDKEWCTSSLGRTGWPNRIRCTRSSWARVLSNSRLKCAS